MSETMQIPAREVPVLADVDVAVAGGGPAGFAAAVAAARQGARTIVIDAAAYLGGQATGGLLNVWQRTAGTEGVFDELRSRLRTLGGLRDDWLHDPEMTKYAMQQMVEQAGAEQLLCAQACEALAEDSRVTGVLVACKANLAAVRAKVVIDATGDGDIAASAGAAFELGGEGGRFQAATLYLEHAGLDVAAWEAGREEYRGRYDEVMEAERRAGRMHLPAHTGPYGPGGPCMAPGLYRMNLDTAMNVDATDPRQLTDAINASRHRVFEAMAFLRKYCPGAANIRLVATGAQFGVRESRRFRGLASVSGEDVIAARKRRDGICRASFYLDLHDGKPAAEKRRARAEDKPPAGDWYEIPYGCLVPEAVDGLLIAGRCVSSDRRANGSLRIMPTCMALGQAAGVAAALCAAEGTRPRDLPPARVQHVLRENYGVRMAHELTAQA